MDKATGHIHLIIGPMFSGKTTLLFNLAEYYKRAGNNVLLIKHFDDTRYSIQAACTHNK